MFEFLISISLLINFVMVGLSGIALFFLAIGFVFDGGQNAVGCILWGCVTYVFTGILWVIDWLFYDTQTFDYVIQTTKIFQ